jgi:hypothetical protein
MNLHIDKLNKAFESRIRLGIMSVLMVNESVDFARMKELLQTTDGNLASHVAALEKEEYIIVTKQFVGKKPNTSFRATRAGKRAFGDHIDALEKLLKNSR